MRLIYKYPLANVPVWVINVPYGARYLHFDFQLGQPTLWAEVDTDHDDVTVQVRLVMTGQNPPNDCTYVGTAEHDGIVLHCYVSAS